jgi:hypothetical protein
MIPVNREPPHGGSYVPSSPRLLGRARCLLSAHALPSEDLRTGSQESHEDCAQRMRSNRVIVPLS